MIPVYFSRRAEADLGSIHGWIAQDSPRAADRMIDRLTDRVKLLSEHPEAGPVSQDHGPGIRRLVERPYILLYRIRPDSVVIERVVHGARAPGTF